LKDLGFTAARFSVEELRTALRKQAGCEKKKKKKKHKRSEQQHAENSGKESEKSVS